jgi:photosystem II stability/assembly factor-like uncharacterized protein
MADEDLRRNLRVAFDPGPNFPSTALVSRTVASLPREIGARPRGLTLPHAQWILPFVAALLVIATVATLVLAGRLLPRATIPASPLVPAPASGSGFHYSGTDVPYMVSESIGWTVDYPISLKRTTDGGAHWSLVPGQDQMDFAGAGWRDYAIDATHAWIVVSKLDESTFVYRTADAGRSWSKGESVATPGGFGQLFFIDPENGWVMTFAAPNNTPTQAGTLIGDPTTGPRVIFRTTDGGMHWTRLGEHVNPAPGCQWDGISFASATTGWMGVDCTSSGQRVPILFVTHDGGITWSPQSQPIGTWTCPPRVPSFTDMAHGTAVACDAAGRQVLLETSDAGLTWQVQRLPFEKFGPPPPADSLPGVRGPFSEQVGFSDAVHGWTLLCNPRTLSFYRTDDGGQSWRDESANLTKQVSGSCVGISFLDASVGLAWKNDSSSGTQYLYKSTDGGMTWKLTVARRWEPHFP